jgi:hypothetical protein
MRLQNVRGHAKHQGSDGGYQDKSKSFSPAFSGDIPIVCCEAGEAEAPRGVLAKG